MQGPPSGYVVGWASEAPVRELMFYVQLGEECTLLLHLDPQPRAQVHQQRQQQQQQATVGGVEDG